MTSKYHKFILEPANHRHMFDIFVLTTNKSNLKHSSKCNSVNLILNRPGEFITYNNSISVVIAININVYCILCVQLWNRNLFRVKCRLITLNINAFIYRINRLLKFPFGFVTLSITFHKSLVYWILIWLFKFEILGRILALSVICILQFYEVCWTLVLPKANFTHSPIVILLIWYFEWSIESILTIIVWKCRRFVQYRY